MATSAGTIPINAVFNSAQLEKDVLAALNRIQSKSSLNLNTRNFTQPLGKITGQAKEFQKSLEASNARVIAFGASAGIIYNVQKAFSALVASTIEVEKSLTDINIVLNTSSAGIKQFGDQLFTVAKQTGSSFKDVASAATEFSRQGLGLEETLKRTRDALILTRLSGLDVVSSTEALTSAVNSFAKEALTTTEVVNKLAAVDARFAVSSRDLSEAIQRVGSSASEAGVSFDELLGIVTAVQQTTARGGAVIGNALKTIFTRIERPQVLNDLRDFGISVTDISGNTLPAIKVLENLAQSFQNLSPVVKSQVAELVGGVYQINILKASLADLSKENSVFAGATNASTKAIDEAIVKNKALNESLSALLNQTTQNLTSFATKVGSVSVAPGIRKVLGFINEELEGANTKSAEDFGSKVGAGLLTGLTNFITGPGVLIGVAGLGKLFATFSKFSKDAFQQFLGLNTISRQESALQENITEILKKNPALIQDIISGSKARLQVEKEIANTLMQQSALAEGIKQTSLAVSKSLITGGLQLDTRTGKVKNRAGGYIPAQDKMSEVISAAKGGYVAGKVVNAPDSVGGIMNTAESVKYVPGFSQPFILPPAGSKAASSLASRSMSKTGINPYLAQGFVPNFAPTIEEWYYTKRKENQLQEVGLENGKLTGNFTGATLNSAFKFGVPLEDIRQASGDLTYEYGVRAIKRGLSRAAAQLPPYMAQAEMLTLESPQMSGQIIQRSRGAGKVPISFKVVNLSKEALENNKVDLRAKADGYANELLTDFTNDLPGGQKSTPELRKKYLSAVQNPAAQFAGKIFEAGINLSRDYTREGKGGGDFDVRGGANINKVRELFPGFTSNLGDYKLKYDDDSESSFAKKIESEFGGYIKLFEDEQRAKAASVDIAAEAAKLKASGAKVTEIVKSISPGSKKAFGFIPNFNALSEAINKEMGAGYAMSQIRVGKDNSLKNPLNPSGLGVFNTTEGTLGNGISLARKAGINPKTKGMAAGFIPNFAEGFDKLDTAVLITSLALFGKELKSLSSSFKSINIESERLVQNKRTELAQSANAIKKLKKEAASKFSFANIDQDLNVTGRLRTSRGQYANPKQIAEFESIRGNVEAQREVARKASQQQRIASAGYLNPLSLREGGKLNTLVRTSGSTAGFLASGALSVAEQYIPESNKTGRAAVSGLSDVAQFAGMGAMFGPAGLAVGALVGLGSAAKKFVDAKAEQSMYDLSSSLDKLKETSSKFSGAAQNYTTSLEGLQSALNDPKTQPQALLKFQTTISDSLAAIPEEFRGKILAAGTDISKVADAISQVNKELGSSQQNLERQLAIVQLVNSKTGIIAGKDLKKTDQDQLARLFTQSIDPQKILSGFKGGAGEFSSFIDRLRSSAFTTKSYTIPSTGYGAPQTFTSPIVNEQALGGIKSQLEAKGIFGPEIAAQFEKTSKDISVENVKALFDAIDKFGKGVFSSKEAADNLVSIQRQNIEIAKKSAEIIKNLNSKYESLNFLLSSQIDAEKNRASTLRDLNKIQAEGAIQLATAGTRGALGLATPFMSEAGKLQAESDLELNQITNKRNSEIRAALDKTLSSFTDIVTKKAEDIRSKAFSAVGDTSRTQEDISKELNVFNRNIQAVSPLISSSLKEISGTGNVDQVRRNLIGELSKTSLFKQPEIDLIAGQLNNSFEDLINEIAKITEQGKFDLAIQKVNSDYQKRSLELNQKLSLAGGAGALGSTGQVGVSELFDKLTELTNSLAQSTRVGNAAERGSSIFKLLDTLSNQYNIRGGGVGTELAPLQNASIRGRAEQIQKEGDKLRRLTNISLIGQTGRGIQEGGALDTAFKDLSKNAVSTAIDQVTSQLKLENTGPYLDLLAQEAQYLNQLTEQQTKILQSQAPSITETFKTVTTEQVGKKLDTLNLSLISALRELATNQADIEIKKQIQNLLPVGTVQQRESALSQIINYKGLRGQSLENLSATTGVPLENIKLIQSLEQQRKEIREYGGIGIKNSASVFSAIRDSASLKNYQAKNIPSSATSDFKFYDVNPASTTPSVVSPIKPKSLVEAEQKMLEFQSKLQQQKNAKIEEINAIYETGDKELADQLLLEEEIKDRRMEITERLRINSKRLEDLYGPSGFGDTFFKEEKAAEMNKRIEDRARLGQVDIGGITEKNTTYNRADFARDTGQLIDTFQTDFKSGIASAFGEAIKGTKTLKDAFRDMFQGILNRMLDKSLEMGVDALFAFGKAAATGRKDGGLIKGYNSGGMVTGGSGMRDDVPAMMSGGEFVIKKSSVNKYGAGYLRALNGGIVPRYATGGFSIGPLQNEFLYNDPERPTSGEYAIDSRLSAMALTDETNPQNRLREDRFNKLDQYLQDRDQFEKDKKQALKNYRNQVNSTFYSGLISAGVQLGAAGLTMGAEKLKMKGYAGTTAGRLESSVGNSPEMMTIANGRAVMPRRGALGGYIPRFAGGGSTGKDNIPALLMGGEYVMNKKAVDMYGKDFMGQLNAGTLPKYASGGLVGTSYTAQGNPQTSVEELVTALNTLNENLSKDGAVTQAESGKISAAGATQESGMSVVNNISINVAQGGEVTSEANSTAQQGQANSQNNQNNIQNNAKLAELLRSKVVEVLVEQKRPGGLLYGSR